jgi:Flp pilus assembly protein TadB
MQATRVSESPYIDLISSIPDSSLLFSSIVVLRVSSFWHRFFTLESFFCSPLFLESFLALLRIEPKSTHTQKNRPTKQTEKKTEKTEKVREEEEDEEDEEEEEEEEEEEVADFIIYDLLFIAFYFAIYKSLFIYLIYFFFFFVRIYLTFSSSSFFRRKRVRRFII